MFPGLDLPSKEDLAQALTVAGEELGHLSVHDLSEVTGINLFKPCCCRS